MTDTELTTLSTVIWLVGTVALFILLAHWSTGESWGLTSAIVNGVRSWSASTDPSPRPAAGGRIRVATDDAGDPEVAEPESPAADVPAAELVELGDRPIR